MPQVTFIKDGQEHTFEAQEGETLLDVALRNDLEIVHACGGNGCCTTCIIALKEHAENVSEPNDAELAMGIDPEDPKKERLSCQAQVKGDMVVEVTYSLTQFKKLTTDFIFVFLKFCIQSQESDLTLKPKNLHGKKTRYC